MDAFLTEPELLTLTGCKIKSKRIDALRKAGVPFYVNATGHPVVARSAIDARSTVIEKPKAVWVPRVLKAG